MKSIRFTIAKNATANIMRGGASAIVAIVLPLFLTRALGPDRFAGWALMLQVAAFANYLDFGLQTAIARYLAGALELRDYKKCNQVLSAAIAILTLAGGVAVLCLALTGWQLRHLFPSVPPSLAGEIGIGVAILGVSAGIGLPLSAYSGILIGMQRNEFPAITVAASRTLGAIAVVLVARHTASLIWLSACVAAFNLLASLAQYLAARKLLPAVRFSMAAISRTMTSELVRYCATLSIWSFSMLLVSGLDVTIVGFFNFSAAGAYSIAATLILFFTGLINAAYAAMLAPMAVMQARYDYARISRLVLLTTRINSYFSIGVIVLAFLFGETIIVKWVGASYVGVALPVLKILLIAQAVRLAGSAYGTALVGLGLQRYGILPAIVEGIANLILSIFGMILIGPVGVAWATLIAAALAVSIVIFSILPRISEFQLNRTNFLLYGTLIPMVAALPFCGWMVLRTWSDDGSQSYSLSRTLVRVLVLTITALLIWIGVRRTFHDMRHANIH